MQTDFIRYKPILSDANLFYPTQTDFIRKSSIQTDFTTNITIISYFSYYRTKVTTATTTATTNILLGPRCFATRGQKVISGFEVNSTLVFKNEIISGATYQNYMN